MGITGSNDRRKGTRRSARPAPARHASRKKKPGEIMRFKIPSDFIAGREVQEKILDSIAASGFTGQDAFAVKLSLEEALINAIKHGNKLDPAKNVTVEADVSPGKVEIIIEDEGPGFNRSCVPDPTLEENLQKCSGRGILLIEAYMTSVKWSKGGRRVHMVKVNEE
jgi:serine/threonine-protein kinase RsbW